MYSLIVIYLNCNRFQLIDHKRYQLINEMADKVIEDAVLHIEVEEQNFFVRGIAQPGKKDERKWYLFEKEDQSPSAHPLLKDQILKLRVTNFRNLPISKEKLAPYLTEDKKGFAFKGVPLVADHEKSITENG